MIILMSEGILKKEKEEAKGEKTASLRSTAE